MEIIEQRRELAKKSYVDSLKKSEPKTNEERIKRAEMIATCAAECFDCMDIYGLKPEQLENRIRAMRMDLIEYSAEIIHEAFTKARRTRKKIPTPCDMIEICESVISEKRKNILKNVKKWSEWEGDFASYKNYIAKELKKHGLD